MQENNRIEDIIFSAKSKAEEEKYNQMKQKKVIALG